MRTAIVMTAASMGTLAGARAIPTTGNSQSVVVNGSAAEASFSAFKRRTNSLDFGKRANITASRGGGTRNPDAVIVNTTRSVDPETRSRSRSASSISSAYGTVGESSDLAPRKNNYINSNGDGRYIPDANCTETGIWDTRPPGRCKTKQDDIDAANKAKKEDSINRKGIIATASICGPLALGGAGYGLYRCFRRR